MSYATPSLATGASPAAMFSMSVRGRIAGAGDHDDDRAVHAGRARRCERAEGHHAHAESDRRPRAADSGAGYAELKVKVEQTLGHFAARQSARAQAPAARTIEAGDAAAAGSEASGASLEVQMRLRVSDGRVDARLKIETSGSGEGLAQALEGFTTALYSALRMLFGGSSLPAPASSGAAAPSLPAPGVGEAATPAGAEAAAAVSTDSAVDATAAAAVAAASVGSAASDQPAQAAETVEVTGPAEPAVAMPTASGSLHISLRVRMTYGGFENQLGSLTMRLAASGSASAGGAFDDLLAPFARLGEAGGFDGSASALKDFLQSLAVNLADGAQRPALPLPDESVELLPATALAVA